MEHQIYIDVVYLVDRNLLNLLLPEGLMVDCPAGISLLGSGTHSLDQSYGSPSIVSERSRGLHRAGSSRLWLLRVAPRVQLK